MEREANSWKRKMVVETGWTFRFLESLPTDYRGWCRLDSSLWF